MWTVRGHSSLLMVLVEGLWEQGSAEGLIWSFIKLQIKAGEMHRVCNRRVAHREYTVRMKGKLQYGKL